MKHDLKTHWRLLAMSMALIVCWPAWAQKTPNGDSGKARVVADPLGRAVDDRRLAGIRGGFDTGTGLMASFGFERLVYVNGSLVSSTQVQIPDIGHMTAEQAQALSAVAHQVQVVQVGPGNVFDPVTLQQSMGATVIQNSLDNQSLQTLTRLDISLNGLDLSRSFDVHVQP